MMKSRRTNHRLAFLQAGIILALLVGCGEKAPLPATAGEISRTPTLTSLPAEPSTPTWTPRPTRPFRPTLSAEEKAILATQDAIEQATRAVEETVYQAYQSAQESLPAGCSLYSYDQLSFSPDGAWTLATCGADIWIVNSDGSHRELHYMDYVYHEGYEGGLLVDHWSQDGKYLFFYYATFGDGGPCYAGGGYAHGLYRLDVQTGEVATILPMSEMQPGVYLFSFSSTGRRLAYQPDTRGGQTIVDLITGEQFSLDVAADGGYLWSQDGTHFVFMTEEKSREEEEIFSLWLVDVIEQTKTRLLREINVCIDPLSWSEDNILTYELVDWSGGWDGAIITMNPLTGSILTSVTTTPEP